MAHLLVALGGGGDAIAAVAVAGILGLPQPLAILTYSWDRLLVDPVPGPRTSAEFENLHTHANGAVEILPETRSVPPANSLLPLLAADLPARLFLLDPVRGAVEAATHLARVAELVGAEHLYAVDVGGDALTFGNDEGLRSPLADQLALAACIRAAIPTTIIVAGLGLDGELDARDLAARIHAAGGSRLGGIDKQALAPARKALSWHPSEATGLLAAAADGYRGKVEIRDAAAQVTITERSVDVYGVALDAIEGLLPAAHLTQTSSLTVASRIVERETGISELTYESAKAFQPRHPSANPAASDLPQIDLALRGAKDRGADFTTVRRLAEQLHLNTFSEYEALRHLIDAERPGQRAGCLVATVPHPTRE